jgi:F-type H+-transporting ATPase subunit b
MDLLNQTLNSFSTQIADGGISLQFDLFDSNIINLSILVGGLFYLLSGPLSESLSARQQTVIGAIQDSEEKLEKATKALLEIEESFRRSKIIAEEILENAEETAVGVKSIILVKGKEDIDLLNAIARFQIRTIENRIRKQISDYIATLALQRATLQLEDRMNPRLQQKIIDRRISILGEMKY